MVTPEPTLPGPPAEPRPVQPGQPGSPDAPRAVVPNTEPTAPTTPPTRDGTGGTLATAEDPNAPQTGQQENGPQDPANPEAGNGPTDPDKDPNKAATAATTGQLEAATAQVGTGNPPLEAGKVLEAFAKGNLSELVSPEKAGARAKLHEALQKDVALRAEQGYKDELEAITESDDFKKAVEEVKAKYTDPNDPKMQEEMNSLTQAAEVTAAGRFLATDEGKQYQENSEFGKALKDPEIQKAAQSALEKADPRVQEAVKTAQKELKDAKTDEERNSAFKKLGEVYSKFGPTSKKEWLILLIEIVAALALPTVPIVVTALVFSKMSDQTVEKFMELKAKRNQQKAAKKGEDPTGHTQDANVETAEQPASAAGQTPATPAGNQQTEQTPSSAPVEATPPAQHAPEQPEASEPTPPNGPAKPPVTTPPAAPAGTPVGK